MTQKVMENKKKLRLKRKLRSRAHCIGTNIRPRVTVFRSNRYFYAQVIDDGTSSTIASINGKKMLLGNNKNDVSKIGVEFAKILLSKNIKEVVFDRNGYLYHGVVATFADSLRQNGIVF